MTDDIEEAERMMPMHEASAATPEAELIASLDVKRLQDAVLTLPLLFREAIVMREINGASYREIARFYRCLSAPSCLASQGRAPC